MSTPESGPGQPLFDVPSFGGCVGTPGAIAGVSFWPRVGARVIDTIVHYVAVLCASLLFGILLAIAAGITHQPVPSVAGKLNHLGLMGFVFMLAGSVAYEVLCESLHGSTLGKLILSMVVLQEDGTPCRFKAALIRSLAYFVPDGLVFGVVAYFAMRNSPQKQRIGDEWAHTIVCKRSSAPPESLRSLGRFIVALMLGMMADAALMMILLLVKIAF